MKRKLIIFAFSILMFISFLHAERKETRSFDIQGAYGEVCEIYVEPIPAQSQTYVAGMPFSIEDATVQPGATTAGGRYIADWGFISNTDVNLYVMGEYLTSVETLPKSENHAELPYTLTFEYELAYNDADGTVTSFTGTFEYTNSSGENYYKYEIIPSGINAESGFLGALNGAIYFEFVNTIKSSSSYDSYPAGDYTANVYVVIEEKVL